MYDESGDSGRCRQGCSCCGARRFIVGRLVIKERWRKGRQGNGGGDSQGDSKGTMNQQGRGIKRADTSPNNASPQYVSNHTLQNHFATHTCKTHWGGDKQTKHRERHQPCRAKYCWRAACRRGPVPPRRDTGLGGGLTAASKSEGFRPDMATGRVRYVLQTVFPTTSATASSLILHTAPCTCVRYESMRIHPCAGAH